MLDWPCIISHTDPATLAIIWAADRADCAQLAAAFASQFGSVAGIEQIDDNEWAAPVSLAAELDAWALQTFVKVKHRWPEGLPTGTVTGEDMSEDTFTAWMEAFIQDARAAEQERLAADGEELRARLTTVERALALYTPADPSHPDVRELLDLGREVVYYCDTAAELLTQALDIAKRAAAPSGPVALS